MLSETCTSRLSSRLHERLDPGDQGQSGRGGGELEHRMAGCLFDELVHWVVALGIEEWGGYRTL